MVPPVKVAFQMTVEASQRQVVAQSFRSALSRPDQKPPAGDTNRRFLSIAHDRARQNCAQRVRAGVIHGVAR
jgi:hypothetical protein